MRHAPKRQDRGTTEHPVRHAGSDAVVIDVVVVVVIVVVVVVVGSSQLIDKPC